MPDAQPGEAEPRFSPAAIAAGSRSCSAAAPSRRLLKLQHDLTKDERIHIAPTISRNTHLPRAMSGMR